ncbi:hypothetical protein IFR05_005642 [Cadophora sp. M221]|nr:hypothetical protein IFR05_005642 [Cadophora sp. M221]
MQQASCKPPKATVVIIIAIAGHTNMRQMVEKRESLMKSRSCSAATMFDELNNERGNHRKYGAGAENEAIVDEEASGPADGQIEPRDSIGLDNEVVKDSAGANGPSANLKSPFAEFICVVGARGRTVDGDEIQRPDADFSLCGDGVTTLRYVPAGGSTAGN